MDLKISFITLNYPKSIAVLRFVATLIDALFFFILSDIFMLLNQNFYIHILLMLSIMALYYVLVEGLTGYTIGKVIARIKVVNNEGYAPGLIKSIIRSAFRLVEVNPYILGGLIAGIVCFSSARRQRIGDLVAGTYVIKVKNLKNFFENIENQILNNENSLIDKMGNSSLFNNDSNTFFRIDSSYISDIGKHKNEINKGKKKAIIATSTFSLLVVLSIVFMAIYPNNYNDSYTNSYANSENFKGKKMTGKSKAVEIAVPYSWFKSVSNEYEILVGDNDAYVAVVRIDKDDYAKDFSLLEYCEAKNYDLSNNIKNGTGTEFENIMISGHPAIRFEYSGEEDNYKISYLFTVVEVPDAFYQIAGWTTQKKFASSRETFQNVADSFRLKSESKEVFSQKYLNQKGNYR